MNESRVKPTEAQEFDPRVTQVDWALKRFFEEASTVLESPPMSPWAQPADVAEMSLFNTEVVDDSISLRWGHEEPERPALVKEDSEAEIRELLQQGINEDVTNDDGQTALHLAAKQDEFLTREVLGRGVDINVKNVDGDTALMSAVIAETEDTVKLLLKKHADVNAAGEQQRTCLHYAAIHNREPVITVLLLRRNPHLEAEDENGLTPLFTAALFGNETVARVLLKHGAQQIPRKEDGWTALHYASMQANNAFMSRLLQSQGPDVEAFYDLKAYGLEVAPTSTIYKRRAALVHLLLNAGASVNAKRKGYSSLQLAAITAQELVVSALLSHGATAEGTSLLTLNMGLSPEIIDKLIERGANIEMSDPRHHKTALIWAAETGSPDTVKILLAHGADVMRQDDYGSSALHYASANARLETVQALLEKGADPNLLDEEQKVPLIKVAWGQRFFLGYKWWDPSMSSREKTASLLLNARADVFAVDLDGKSALHYAAENGYLDVLKTLVAKGGGDLIELQDRQKWTALMYARERAHSDVVKYLRRRLLGKKHEEGGLTKVSSLESNGTTASPSPPRREAAFSSLAGAAVGFRTSRSPPLPSETGLGN